MNGFTVYKEYYDLITLLPEREAEKLSWAIWKYMFEDIEPELNDRQMKIFSNLKRPLDVSKNNSKRATKTKPNKNQNENRNNNRKKTHQDVNVIVSNYDNNYVVNVNNNLFEYIEQTLGRTISPTEAELISTWEDNEVTRYAIKQTALNRKTTLKYTQGILNSFKEKGITTLAEVEADEQEYQKGKKERSKQSQKTELERKREILRNFRDGQE